MKIEELRQLHKFDVFRQVDLQFADLLQELSGVVDPHFYIACLLASTAASEGHVCVSLEKCASTKFPVYTQSKKKWAEREGIELPVFELPSLAEWCSVLRQEKLRDIVGLDEYKPLVLDGQGRLYLHRQWHDEQLLANHLKERAGGEPHLVSQPELLRERLDALFDPPEEEKVDWQKLAAFASLNSRFLVLTGGPGTGKTYTVARIAALLIEQSKEKKLRLRLTAPTGKAAARMSEAVSQAKADTRRFICASEVREQIPDTASTIHRLLGSRSNSPNFRHNSQNPLTADVVIVDEASMVDVSLMTALLNALPKRTRLILLGDKDQLASVAPGSVLADICEAADANRYTADFAQKYALVSGERIDSACANSTAPLADCVVQLNVSRRFDSNSFLGRFSRAVNLADGASGAERAWHLLRELNADRESNICWHPLPPNLEYDSLPSELIALIHEGYRDFLLAETPEDAIAAFQKFQILCAVKDGPYGTRHLNELTERIFGIGMQKSQYLENFRMPSSFYSHRPVMIQQNDYNVGLFNGDIGVTLQDQLGNKNVWFKAAEERLRSVRPNLLPPHETAFAMTVHKSQGSEFDQILLILPDQDSPLLTRELIYTAITRSKGRILIWCNERTFKAAVQRRAERVSGLVDRLIRVHVH